MLSHKIRNKTSKLLKLALGLLSLQVFISVFGASCTSSRKDTLMPLDNDNVRELCQDLGLVDEQHELCKSDNSVYAADFLPYFREAFVAGDATFYEIVGKLGASSFKHINPFVEYYDLKGDGIHQIFIYSDHQGIVRSIVITRKEIPVILSSEDVRDLCNTFALPQDSHLCDESAVVYAQDFFPILRESFPLGETRISQVKETLRDYRAREKARFYTSYYYFESGSGQAVFYFNADRVVEWITVVDQIDSVELAPKVIEDLCIQFGLSDQDTRCQPDANVTVMDFMAVLREAFPYGEVDYEFVQSKLARYQVEFTPPVRDANGDAVILSWYDLIGNHSTAICFDFDTDALLKRITITSFPIPRVRYRKQVSHNDQEIHP